MASIHSYRINSCEFDIADCLLANYSEKDTKTSGIVIYKGQNF
jgi:hypothetical protein